MNELVTISLDGSDGAGRLLVAGSDFYAAPRPSPDGRTLAWLEWDHPDMPWDARPPAGAPMSPRTARLGPARTVAGGPDVSIVQPAWRADGVLHFVSDAPSGWWNLSALDGDGASTARPEPGADGGGARRPRVGLRPVVVRVHRRRRDPGRGPRRRPRRARADHVGRCRRTRGRAVQRDRGAPDRGRDRGADRGRPARRRRGRPPEPRDRPADGRARAIARDPARPRRAPARRAHRLPDDRWRDGSRPVLPARPTTPTGVRPASCRRCS